MTPQTERSGASSFLNNRAYSATNFRDCATTIRIAVSVAIAAQSFQMDTFRGAVRPASAGHFACGSTQLIFLYQAVSRRPRFPGGCERSSFCAASMGLASMYEGRFEIRERETER